MSPEQFPIAPAQLAGSFCETLFYGIYLVTCGFCARSLLFTGSGYEERRLRIDEIRWMMVAISSLLFLTCTFNLSIGVLHNFHAFIRSDNPEKEFLNLGDWINIARSSSLVLSVFIGDFALVYRCWIVCGHRWLVVLPSIILWLAGIAMGVMCVEVEGNPSTDKASAIGTSTAIRWALALFAITAVQTTLTSGILIWRIWQVEKECERYYNLYSGSGAQHPSRLKKVIRVIAESGTAYTTMMLITFFVGLSKSNAIYLTSDMAMMTTGIVFNVIIVRATPRRDRQFTQFGLGTTIMEFNPTGSDTTSRSTGFIPNNNSKINGDINPATVMTDHGTAEVSSRHYKYPNGIVLSQGVVRS